MEPNKLKIKIGQHEFEAEGPSEVVQSQFEAFRELVSALPPQKPADAEPTPAASSPQAVPSNAEPSLERIMKVDGRIVSLTARRESLDDEIILVLFGQKMFRNNDSVTGAEVIDGLKLTGRTVRRIDYQLDKMAKAGDAIVIGTGRARRYRLTNTGLAKARDIANSILATVA
jgi:hypothetical protein